MQDGKKSLAERIVYDALAIVGERSKRGRGRDARGGDQTADPGARGPLAPRVGGATYQVPVEVPARRARTLAVRWLVDFARNRREYSMSERLAGEILDAIQQQGGAWKRKDDIYRMAAGQQSLRPLPLVRRREDALGGVLSQADRVTR